MREYDTMAGKDKHVRLLELKLPKWPLREKYFEGSFKEYVEKKGKKFDEAKLAQDVGKAISTYLIEQQSKAASRESGRAGTSTTTDTVAPMSEDPVEGRCYFIGAQLELCYDASNGEVYLCLCEYYKCDDCSWYKECFKIELPWL